MEKDTILSVKGVYKKFCKNIKLNMWYGLVDLAKNMLGVKQNNTILKKGEFWALEDINFELKRGQVLGLIGSNGSGKTTLLRLIAGIYPPDRGEITVKGRVGSLISLGAGFHPYMTGRENIYLNGTILGMTKKEIEEMLDFIIDFSELGDFIDTPVAQYSSGMRVRLGFSIAIASKPDLVLLDEVLAVGDRRFRGKCYKEIDKLIKDSAVIFVSHSMPNILRVSTHIMVLHMGKIKYLSDNVYEGIDYYYSLMPSDNRSISGIGARIIDFKLFSEKGYFSEEDQLYIVEYLETLYIYLKVALSDYIKTAIIRLEIVDSEFNTIAACKSDTQSFYLINRGMESVVKIALSNIQFSNGKYSITLKIFDADSNENILTYHNIAEFQVRGNAIINTPLHLNAQWEEFVAEEVSK